LTVKPSCAACFPSLCLKKTKKKKHLHLQSTTVFLPKGRQKELSLFSPNFAIGENKEENSLRFFAKCSRTDLSISIPVIEQQTNRKEG